MPDTIETKKKNFFLESFKTIFSKRDLGKEAAEETNRRLNSNQQRHGQ